MSILIKGMDMPTSCIACHLNFGEKRPEYGLTIFCPYSDGVISWRDKAFDNGRLASCGIVPVPPHGRLGDLDKLEQMFSDIDHAPYSGFDGSEPFYSAEDAAQIIRLAPTIIQAEEGE